MQKERESGKDESVYRENIIKEILNWREEEPGILAQAIGIAAFPVNWLVKQIIPQSAIKGALSAADWVSRNTTTAPGANSFDDLKVCDDFADQVINFHIGVAIAEGGAAGFFGLPGIVMDVPAIVMLAIRLIRQVSYEYGYSDTSASEQQYILSVLAAASANTQEEKMVALATNVYIGNLIAKNAWKVLAEKAAVEPMGGAAAVIGVKNLAKQLGLNITKRSALAAIPVIGAAVGASANGWFIKDVGIAAQHIYQERWLRDRNLWIDGELSQSATDSETSDPESNVGGY